MKRPQSAALGTGSAAQTAQWRDSGLRLGSCPGLGKDALGVYFGEEGEHSSAPESPPGRGCGALRCALRRLCLSECSGGKMQHGDRVTFVASSLIGVAVDGFAAFVGARQSQTFFFARYFKYILYNILLFLHIRELLCEKTMCVF